MKIIIKKLCPKCKREKEFENIWTAIFRFKGDEDYSTFKNRSDRERKEHYYRELPKLQMEFAKVSEKLMNEEMKIKDKMPEEFHKIKMIGQEVMFIRNRIDYMIKEIN